MSSDVIVRLSGLDRADARLAGAGYRETLGPSANTARVAFGGPLAPVVGEAAAIVLVSESPERVLFAGEVLRIVRTYDGRSGQVRWDADLVDRTWRLNDRRPRGTWSATSATDIALALAAAYAPACTTAGVEAGLPPVSIIFDGSEPFLACWQRLATALPGGLGLLTPDNDLALFQTWPYAATDPVDPTHPPLLQPAITFTSDESQVRTRVYGKGYIGKLAADVAAGETILPVADEDAAIFEAGGGAAILGQVPGAAQSEVVTYAAALPQAGGTFVGPGAAPSSAPGLALALGSGLELGVYRYAYTDVTGAGESLPSPLGTITTVLATTDPAHIGDAFKAEFAAGGVSGVTVTYRYTFRRLTDGTETAPSPATTPLACSHARVEIPLAGCDEAPAGHERRWWRSDNGAAYRLMPAVLNPTWWLEWGGTATLIDTVPTSAAEWSGTPTLPSANTTGGQQVAISSIALGPSGTIARNVYRTDVNGAQLKLQQTIANNSTTDGAQDATPDASLGAEPPTSDTSGLTQPTGQVNIGAAELLLASAAGLAAEGWVLVGGAGVRYTSISGNTLQGLPASGPGALAATVLYGAAVRPAAMLTDVAGAGSPSGVGAALARGASVAVWVQVDDVFAQAALAAVRGGDGVREDLVVDGRMAAPALAAACLARLAQFARVVVSAEWSSWDLRAVAGAPVTVALSTPVTGTFSAAFSAAFGAVTGALAYGIPGVYTVQDATVTFVGAAHRPQRRLRAASVAFTLADFFRLAQLGP